MLLKPKNILIFFISMFLTVSFIPLLHGFIFINKILLYILTLILIFTVLIVTEVIFSRLYNKKPKTTITVETEKTNSDRQSGLDIIRSIAVFFVPLIHFFGLSGYYNTDINNSYIFCFTLLRWAAVCAVPLFLVITGYFKINKTISKSHYKGIIPIMLSHIFISSIRIIVDYKYHEADINIKYILDKLLYFEYGWYVKLYIGMLLLMPFLNLCYNKLKDKEQKQYLILTLMFLTSIGSLCFNIIPVSWLILYVFMYYFIGGYLREYRPKINKFYLLILLVLTLVITSMATYMHSNGSIFDWDYMAYSSNSGYSALPVVITTTLIFLIFMDVNIKFKIPKKIFQSISVVSLEMYLFSQMFDGIIYKPFQELNLDFYHYADKILIIVPTIFCLSFIASKAKEFLFWVLSVIFKYLNKLFLYCFSNHRNNIKTPENNNIEIKAIAQSDNKNLSENIKTEKCIAATTVKNTKKHKSKSKKRRKKRNK